MKTKEMVASLRELADWYEQHPTLPLPYEIENTSGLFVFLYGHEEQTKDILREIGSFEKVYDDPTPGDFSAVKMIGSIKLKFHGSRNTVCTPKVVGKRIIKKRVIPATKKQTIPAYEEDIIEWDCHPVLEEK